MAKIRWTEDAINDLQKLDRPLQKRLLKKISWFGKNFYYLTPEPLSGELAGFYKIRIGDWRVIYTLEEEVIVIQAIGHRKEIYQY